MLQGLIGRLAEGASASACAILFVPGHLVAGNTPMVLCVEAAPDRVLIIIVLPEGLSLQTHSVRSRSM